MVGNLPAYQKIHWPAEVYQVQQTKPVGAPQDRVSAGSR